MENLLLSLLVAFIGIAALLVLLATAKRDEARKHAQRATELKNILSLYQASCTDFQRRFSLVSSHAPDYILSLGKETSNTILEFSNLMQQQDLIIAQIQAMISSPNPSRHEEAARLIEAQRAKLDNKALVQSETNLSSENPEAEIRWVFEAKANELLQSVGRDLYLASEKASIFSGQKSERSKRLLAHLQEAGVIPPIIE